jgi:outer membrane immunogenic protein
MAADLRVKAPLYKAPPPIELFSWTGCYVGGHVGGLWARKEWINADARLAPLGISYGSHDADSVLGGFQGGCNYQVGSWVFGIQGDYAWTDARGDNVNAVLMQGQLRDQSRIRSLASVTGRVGYAWDRFLGYVKGGGAWERDNYDVLSVIGGVVQASAAETRGGWTVGIGAEYAFSNWLSAFAEYDYYDFGTRSNIFTFPNGGVATTIDIKETKSVFKVGLNARWGWGPVIAKY